MKKAGESCRVAGISDAAVQKATGKTWKEWLAILDRAGARRRAHRDIAAYVYKTHKISGWWSQMVTVGYEQARGRRAKQEKPEGYSIGRSVTLGVPVARLFNAWQDGKARARWLKDSEFAVRKATSAKSLRVIWADGTTHLDVNFYSKGADKSQVSLQHSKLASAREAARLKAYWGEQLDRLKQQLESRR